MRSSVKVGTPDAVVCDMAALTTFQLGGRRPTMLRGFDRTVQDEVKRLVASGDFTGKRNETAIVYPSSGPKRLLLIGLGERKEVTPAALRNAAAIAGRRAVAVGAASLTFTIADDVPRRSCPPAAVGRVVAEGVGQGAWTFEEFRDRDDFKGALRSLTILCNQDLRADIESGRKIGAAMAEGQALTRNLQMTPANHCPPSHLANVARRLGRQYGFRVTVLGRAQIEKAGLNALIAVAQGSKEDPRFIILQYRGAARGQPVCLVGKGVTFDTGGISLKPALSMEEMKFDMSGAAAVLGAFDVIGRLKPKVNVVGVIPATENMPSGTAIKPGDVVRTHFGKTVEIVNTDAEGRLILCDALSYARRFKPACILDIATLTGAVVIALGHHATGVMGNDDDLVAEVTRAGDAAGERCWQFPLWDEYRTQLKSDTADIKNVGGRPAGTITAGWFLRDFVEPDTPWAHLDIAGTAYTDADTPYCPKGPTGAGARLFGEFVLERAAG
jgi:leucyl aminopeptidase